MFCGAVILTAADHIRRQLPRGDDVGGARAQNGLRGRARQERRSRAQHLGLLHADDLAPERRDARVGALHDGRPERPQRVGRDPQRGYAEGIVTISRKHTIAAKT